MTDVQVRDPSDPEPLTTHELARYEDFQQASALYRRVFGYRSDDFALNSNLLSALVRNGGSAVGVRNSAGELIGFAYGFLGSDDSGVFHYSQAAVVEGRYQGRGVGRMLKVRQREVALASGVSTMRWAFDPALGRNGHFNFNTLGAHSAAFVREYYGRAGTDRVLVDWPLADDADPYASARALLPPETLADVEAGVPITDEAGLWIPIPTTTTTTATATTTAGDGAARLHAALHELHEQGFVLVSCRRLDARTSAYLAVPAAEGRAR